MPHHKFTDILTNVLNQDHSTFCTDTLEKGTDAGEPEDAQPTPNRTTTGNRGSGQSQMHIRPIPT